MKKTHFYRAIFGNGFSDKYLIAMVKNQRKCDFLLSFFAMGFTFCLPSLQEENHCLDQLVCSYANNQTLSKIEQDVTSM